MLTARFGGPPAPAGILFAEHEMTHGESISQACLRILSELRKQARRHEQSLACAVAHGAADTAAALDSRRARNDEATRSARRALKSAKITTTEASWAQYAGALSAIRALAER